LDQSKSRQKHGFPTPYPSPQYWAGAGSACKKVKDAKHEGHTYKLNDARVVRLVFTAPRSCYDAGGIDTGRDGIEGTFATHEPTRHCVKDQAENALAAINRLGNLFNQRATAPNVRSN
jgi:hypothetical protein